MFKNLISLLAITASLWPSVTLTAPSPNHWVTTWTAMPQLVEPANLPPIPYNATTSEFFNSTLRQTIHLTLGGSHLRLQLSNLFGPTPLPITAATVALPPNNTSGSPSILPETLHTLTFSGSASITIPPGHSLYTDPLPLSLPSSTTLSITLYLATGQQGLSITGHPGSRTTTWLSPGPQTSHPSFLTLPSTSTPHWYFLTAAEVVTSSFPASTLVLLGDSLTDGRGSTTDQNNRWPDFLSARLRTANIPLAVANQAAGGNAVISGGLGPPLVTRYRRDAFGVAGVSHILILEGVNDIGPSPDTEAGARNVTAGLIRVYRQIIREAKGRGIVVIGGTIMPFQGDGQVYSGIWREQARQWVNKWIQGSGEFDHVVDFASVVGDGDMIKEIYDSGDHLHLNPIGYKVMAEAVNLDLFQNR